MEWSVYKYALGASLLLYLLLPWWMMVLFLSIVLHFHPIWHSLGLPATQRYSTLLIGKVQHYWKPGDHTEIDITCKGVFKNGKPCTYGAKQEGYCVRHYRQHKVES